MSNDEADALVDEFEKWDAREARQKFISRMERKLYRKEHSGRFIH